jgi:hypothetical protein
MITVDQSWKDSERGGREVDLYKVIFLGMTVAGPEEETRLIAGLQKKFNLTPEKAERLLQRVPIVVKKGVSKEEMEKYVKAFEGIGGRIRVEVEEEITELPEISAETEPEKKPYMGRMITCPQCGFEQPETDECVKCGVIISKYVSQQKMAYSAEGQVREVSPEDKSVPWESGEGFLSAFFRTTGDALFSPTRFFKKISIGEGYWTPLIYGLITGIIGKGAAIFWFWLFIAQFIPLGKLPYSFSIPQFIVALPFQQAIAIFIVSAIIHFSLMIVGGNNNGYKTTFRAISYSYSAQLFNIIPIIGSLIGFIYRIILFVLGVREGHGISTGKAVLAILLPVIVGVGVAIVAVVLIPLLLGTLGFFGGRGV